jgi:hypothetical protein
MVRFWPTAFGGAKMRIDTLTSPALACILTIIPSFASIHPGRPSAESHSTTLRRRTWLCDGFPVMNEGRHVKPVGWVAARHPSTKIRSRQRTSASPRPPVQRHVRPACLSLHRLSTLFGHQARDLASPCGCTLPNVQYSPHEHRPIHSLYYPFLQNPPPNVTRRGCGSLVPRLVPRADPVAPARSLFVRPIASALDNHHPRTFCPRPLSSRPGMQCRAVGGEVACGIQQHPSTGPRFRICRHSRCLVSCRGCRIKQRPRASI